MDNVSAAKALIKCLDLTSLGENDTQDTIEKLCQRAVTPYGKTATVCIYPKFIPVAQRCLTGSGVKIATVVNFPSGDASIEDTAKEIDYALHSGADEIDAVFPYKKFMQKDYAYCSKYLTMFAQKCHKKAITKIILETGELKTTSLIISATKFCLDHKIHFIKTSTGKSKVSATPEAANAILETIFSNAKNAGFKASGGIKTTQDAKQYLQLAVSTLGYKWVSPRNFRIGASSLLDDLIATIQRGY